MNSYDLSRNFFNWCFENPEKITGNHIALYFFCIEHCNRLGWKEKFGLPSSMAKEATGIKSYNTYGKCLNDLKEWGFIKIIEKSKNQYSSNIIAISKFNKALDKALDKALIKHSTKQLKSIVSIDKQTNNKQETNKQEVDSFVSLEFIDSYSLWLEYKKQRKESYANELSREAFYKKLLKLSDNNPTIAIQIVNQSIENNWSGIFELKDSGKKTSRFNNTKGTIHDNNF